MLSSSSLLASNQPVVKFLKKSGADYYLRPNTTMQMTKESIRLCIKRKDNWQHPENNSRLVSLLPSSFCLFLQQPSLLRPLGFFCNKSIYIIKVSME